MGAYGRFAHPRILVVPFKNPAEHVRQRNEKFNSQHGLGEPPLRRNQNGKPCSVQQGRIVQRHAERTRGDEDRPVEGAAHQSTTPFPLSFDAAMFHFVLRS